MNVSSSFENSGPNGSSVVYAGINAHAKKIFRIRMFKIHLQFPTKIVHINEHHFTYKRSKLLINMCRVFYSCGIESEL
jgi:hypothetical protein